MKGIFFFAIGIIILVSSCKDVTTSSVIENVLNSAVTTNLPNNFTYTVNANQYSDNSNSVLSFKSDSLTITLTLSDYKSGQAIVHMRDSLNTTIFTDTVASNKTIVISKQKILKPRYCSIKITNLTAKFAFVVVGQ